MFIFTRTLVTYARTIFMPRCCLNFQSMRTHLQDRTLRSPSAFSLFQATSCFFFRFLASIWFDGQEGGSPNGKGLPLNPKCFHTNVAARCKRHTQDVRLGIVFLYVSLRSELRLKFCVMPNRWQRRIVWQAVDSWKFLFVFFNSWMCQSYW